MKSRLKGVLVLVLSLIMFFALTTIASAAVKVGDTELTSGVAFSGTQGTATYDADNNTLTLNNFSTEAGISADVDLTLNLIGANTVTYSESSTAAINVTGDLTIKGSDGSSLTANNTNESESSNGISAHKITITGGTVNASGNAYGIYATEAISITGGTVTATGFDAIAVSEHNANGTVTISGDNTKVTANGVNNGIYAKGPVAISSGEVTATATGEGSCGIYGGNNVTIDGGIVTANGSTNGIHAYDSNESDRIDTGNITISGGTVNATGVVMGIHADSNGTIDGGTVTISGGTVNATGNDGLYANKISISGGTVTATGSNKYGIFALKPTGNGGKIEISNGTVTATGGMGGIGANIDVAISGGTVIAKGTNPTDSVGIYAGNKATIKGGTVTIDAATTAISCTTLNMGSGNWYKWKADSNSIQTSSDTNHLSTETLAGVKKLVIAKEISDPPPPPIHYPPTVTPTTPDEGDKVTAAETLDGGIALSVAMTILTATGSAWLAKKKD